MPYVNLPGSYVQLQDGNLSFFARDLTQSVLVLGTASKGLTSEPFLMTDLGSVIKEFGATSELARTASEVRKGGARNIFVYRLPGIAPSVAGIGADTAGSGGIKITTTQESPEAAAKYGVAYRHAKNTSSDPTESGDGFSVTAELLVVNLETSTIVWQGTALEGATIDNGEVDVQFELGDVDPGVGSLAEAEALEIAVTPGTKTYTNVGSSYVTGGGGTGASFNVTIPTFTTTPAYSTGTVSVNAGGALYDVGDDLQILGTVLGGTSTLNDLVVEVATITAAGRTYSPVAVAGGAGGTVSVTVSSSGVYSVSTLAAGSGYTGGSVTIAGTSFGGATTTNDLTFTIAVNGGGGITGVSGVSGTGKIRGAVATVTITSGTAATHGFINPTYSVSLSGIVASGSITGTMTDVTTAASLLAGALNDNTEFMKLPFEAEADGGVVYIKATGNTNADGELVYGVDHPWAGYTARPFLTAAPSVTGAVGAGSVTLAGAVSYATAKAADIGLYPQDMNKPFASAVGGVYIPLDKIVSGGSIQSYGLAGAPFASLALSSYAGYNFDDTTDAVFSAGGTDESVSAMKRYEKLHTAFEGLDLAPFDFVVCSGIALDSKNAADTSVSFVADTYPTPKTALDALGFCQIVNNGDYTYTYLWSDDAETVKIVSDGTLAEDWTAGTSFVEVNFAHLLAKYCYENSSDYKSVMGVIGTMLPDSITNRGVRAYFGSAPSYTYDYEENAYFVAEATNNGTGLLGHKFIGGKESFNGGLKHGGFFATEDGTLDYSPGNVKLDDNSKKIDLGKYLCAVAIFGRVTDDINPRKPAYITNAAAIVAGMLPLVSPVDSLINMRVPGLTIDYRLETKTVDVACGLGLIVAKNEAGLAVIADSPTFACESSDYKRLTTVRIVGKIAEELRAAAKPYIGKGMSAPKRAAFESAIGEVLKANMAGEPIQTITNGSFKVEQSAADRVLGKMKVSVTIVPVFELRQVTFSVNLSAQ